jgi:hypothetical protein
MKILLNLIAGLMCLGIAQAQDIECEIPGKAMHWVADFCLHQAETDDFQEPKVQACFEKNQGYKIKDTCENRTKYKLMLCRYMVSKAYYQGDAEMCLHDEDFVPTTVRNGGV